MPQGVGYGSDQPSKKAGLLDRFFQIISGTAGEFDRGRETERAHRSFNREINLGRLRQDDPGQRSESAASTFPATSGARASLAGLTGTRDQRVSDQIEFRGHAVLDESEMTEKERSDWESYRRGYGPIPVVRPTGWEGITVNE
jgi:hypothetical protein